MQCDICGANEASVHLTQIEQNETSKRHLCDSCAAAKGLAPSGGVANAPLADFLAQMGKAAPTETAAAMVDACPGCGLTLVDFKRTGRLGCARCWTHYGPSLRGLLRKLHGAAQHTGKVFRASGDLAAPNRLQRIVALRRSLQEAVDQEDFERAASLRDQIRRLEAGEPPATEPNEG